MKNLPKKRVEHLKTRSEVFKYMEEMFYQAKLFNDKFDKYGAKTYAKTTRRYLRFLKDAIPSFRNLSVEE